MMEDERAAVARASYDAYVDKDRASIEALIADDFHFTSPLDNRIDRGSLFRALLAEQRDGRRDSRSFISSPRASAYS